MTDRSEKYWTYVIECSQRDNYYVGKTWDIVDRLQTYLGVKKNIPVGVVRHERLPVFMSEHGGFGDLVDLFTFASDEEAIKKERELTQEYLRKYGALHVAGGAYTGLANRQHYCNSISSHPSHTPTH